MSKITIYRDAHGVWHMMPIEGGVAVEGELAEGYRLAEGVGGSTSHFIYGRAGTIAMTADEAVRRGVIQIPVGSLP